MTNYKFIKAANNDKLIAELNVSAINDLIFSVSVESNLISIDTVRDLSSDEFAVLYSVIDAHNVAEDQLRNKVVSAIAFGQSLIVEVAVENIMLQLTIPQIIAILTKFAGIKAMLESGSLYTALAAMQQIKPDDTMTKERIDKYVNKLKKYLGVP